MIEEDEINMIKDRAQIYLEKEIPVHIIKNNGDWLNGHIVEVSSEFLMLDEYKKGVMPIFFREISKIETFHAKEGGE